MIRIILSAAFALAIAGGAQAQNRAAPKAAVTCVDLANLLPPGCQPKAGGLALPGAPPAAPSCDFNFFADLRNETLKQLLDACAAKLVTDSQAALDDATAENDTTAVNCLKPGTAILKAAVPAKDASGNTTDPGLILLFQKFRDFVMAGGPSACKSWVNTTIAGANPLTN